MRSFVTAALAAGFAVGVRSRPLLAQHEMHQMENPQQMPMLPGPLGISPMRMGSGTSWLPDAAPMHAAHARSGSWMFMLHGTVFALYDKQHGARGDEQVNSLNWVMGMASRRAAGGILTFRAMFSAEPFTVGAKGYPLLLQSGEAYRGEPLHDRQHPHDLFMELGMLYEREFSRHAAFSLYLAPVGEPALGPVAFPHRPSAAADPFAPLAHHWQDATHISFGVVTAGVFTRGVKLEASLFNGREPDERRYNFDYQGRSLDSYAARLSVNPAPEWSLSASYGFLKSAEELQPTESQRRITVSVLRSSKVGSHGQWSSALIYGGNKHSNEDRFQHSVVAESNLDLDGKNTLFGRTELVRKGGEDLDVSAAPVTQKFSVGELTLGYLREVARPGGLQLGIGASGTLNFVPSTLRSLYGSRTPWGFGVYLRVGSEPMQMGSGMPPMPGPKMPGSHVNSTAR
jgi:hypothetical protein